MTRECITHHICDCMAERLKRAEADAAAVRELMNVYNLGGWTNAVEPMKRALRAEAERDALRALLARWQRIELGVLIPKGLMDDTDAALAAKGE